MLAIVERIARSVRTVAGGVVAAGGSSFTDEPESEKGGVVPAGPGFRAPRPSRHGPSGFNPITRRLFAVSSFPSEAVRLAEGATPQARV